MLGIGATNDLVSTTLTVAADGFETQRQATVAGVVPLLTRTIDSVTGRDDAKRVTAATLNTGSAQLAAQYLYDQAGHLTHQWGSGFASEASGAQAYT